ACVQRVGCRYLDGGAPGPVHLADDERLPVARGVGVAAASLAGAGPRAGHGADLAIPAFREALPGISIAVPPVAPLLVTPAGPPRSSGWPCHQGDRPPGWLTATPGQ